MYSSALRSNDAVTVNPAEPPNGSFSWTPGSMTNCCIRFSQRPGEEDEKPAQAIPHKGYLQLYPNPASSHVMVRFQLGTKEPASLYVYNSMGQLVKTWQPKFADQTQHCYFNISDNELKLPSGMYILMLKAGSEIHHTKLIIK